MQKKKNKKKKKTKILLLQFCTMQLLLHPSCHFDKPHQKTNKLILSYHNAQTWTKNKQERGYNLAANDGKEKESG